MLEDKLYTKKEVERILLESVLEHAGIAEYRNPALQTEFIFYGVLPIQSFFDKRHEPKDISREDVDFFLITDQYENHIPWPIFMSELLVTCPFVIGPYDEEVWWSAFEFMKGKPIYLTHNLWTCDCHESQYIWDIDTVCCPKCRCTEDDESYELIIKYEKFVGKNWKKKSTRIPYLNKLLNYPLLPLETRGYLFLTKGLEFNNTIASSNP